MQAQKQSLDSNYTSSRSWQLSLKPLQLIDPNAGTLQVGAEKKMAKHFAVALDYGLSFHPLSYAYKNTGRENYRYSKYCLEVKYSFIKKNQSRPKNFNPYFGLRVFYFPQRYRLHNEYVWKDTAFYPYNYSNLKRNVLAFDAVNGCEITTGRFVYNPYFGVGVRILFLSQQPFGLGAPTGFIAHAEEDYSTHIYRYTGTFYRPDFVFGIRLGYRLGK